MRRSYHQIFKARKSAGDPATGSLSPDVDHGDGEISQVKRFKRQALRFSTPSAYEQAHEADFGNVERIITSESCGVQSVHPSQPDAENMESA